jgi:hypothetical protein
MGINHIKDNNNNINNNKISDMIGDSLQSLRVFSKFVDNNISK